jgi:hypothetical protein
MSDPQITITGLDNHQMLATYQGPGEYKGIQVRASAELTIEQMASVSVAHAAKALRTRLSEVRRDLRQPCSEHAQVRSRLEALMRAYPRENFMEFRYSILTNNLRDLFEATSFSFEYCEAHLDVPANEISFTVRYRFRIKESQPSWSIDVANPIPQEMKDLLAERDRLTLVINELRIRERDTLAALANVDRLHKDSVARFTEETLRRSEDGNALMEKLASHFEAPEKVDALVDSLLST